MTTNALSAVAEGKMPNGKAGGSEPGTLAVPAKLVMVFPYQSFDNRGAGRSAGRNGVCRCRWTPSAARHSR